MKTMRVSIVLLVCMTLTAGLAMKTMRVSIVLLVCMTLTAGLATIGFAGDGLKLPLKRYEGQINSIKIDRCGIEPGQCIGSIILGQKGGDDVELGIRPGSWLKRGGNFVFIEDLGVGNYVMVEAVEMPGDRLQQITVLSSDG